MASADSKLKKILTELNHLSLKRQQLLERKQIQWIFQTEEAASNLHEIDIIDDTLKQLTERKAELQKSHESILNDKDMKNEASITSSQILPDVPGPCVDRIYVEGPPQIPAPRVILDVERFPSSPCRTQCPECKQFITTETFSSVSSGTWLVCFMTASFGCVAGCCLIPFCIKQLKSITHKCPKCRTTITTIKKL